MKPIKVNKLGTVGICEGYNNPADFCGKFNAGLLKEWVELIMQTFGEDADVYLYSHYHMENSARALSATPIHGDEFQVAIAGIKTDDLEVN